MAFFQKQEELEIVIVSELSFIVKEMKTIVPNIDYNALGNRLLAYLTRQTVSKNISFGLKIYSLYFQILTIEAFD